MVQIGDAEEVKLREFDMQSMGVSKFHLKIYSKAGVVAKTLNDYVKEQKEILAASGDKSFKQSPIMSS